MELEEKEAEKIVKETIDFRIKELESTAIILTSLVAMFLSLILVSFSLYRNPGILGIEKSLAKLFAKSIVLISSIIGVYAIYGIYDTYTNLSGFLPHANDYYMNRLELATNNIDEELIRYLGNEFE